MKNPLSVLDSLCKIEQHGTNKLKATWFTMLQPPTADGQVITIGIDEVGRGSVFGPLIVAACANLTGWHLPAVRDSKKIKNPEVRKQIAGEIKHNCVWATVEVPAKAINQFGTINCLIYAGRRVKDAILRELRNGRTNCTYHVIYDGRDHRKCVEGDCRIESIEKADATIFECSCASIIAKATHDVLIERLCEDERYAKYGLINHRGYGTEKHATALRAHGLSDQHRTVASSTLLTEPDDATRKPAGRVPNGDHTDGRRSTRRRATPAQA